MFWKVPSFAEFFPRLQAFFQCLHQALSNDPNNRLKQIVFDPGSNKDVGNEVLQGSTHRQIFQVQDQLPSMLVPAIIETPLLSKTICSYFVSTEVKDIATTHSM